MQLNPVVTEHLDKIQRAGALRVAGNLNLLSGRQPLKNLLTPAGGEGLKLLQLLRDIDLGITSQLADLLNLLLQLNQRFSELKQGDGAWLWLSGVERQWPAGWGGGSRC